MNNMSELINSLNGNKVKFLFKNNRLLISDPLNVITPEIKNKIRSCKNEIIALIQKNKEEKTESFYLESIPSVDKAENYALSNAQRRLWLLDQMKENQIAYNMPAAIQLTGTLDTMILEQAIQLLFERHESLCTNFVEGRQVIRKVVFRLNIQNYGKADPSSVKAAIAKHAHFSFNLNSDVLLQIDLLKIGETEHILLFNMHHIISDGWSMTILTKELSMLYAAILEGNKNALLVLPRLPIQYKDYTAWQNDLLTTKSIDPIRKFWLNNLAPDETGRLPQLGLPTDYPRPQMKTYNGHSINHVFSQSTLTALKQLTQAKGATLFMALTALINILLNRYSEQTDIIIGTPSAGRNHPDLNNQIGFYVNTLVLRNQIQPEDSFSVFLEKVKRGALAAFENELYPFDSLVEELAIPRDTSRSTIFDVMLVLENNEQVDLSLKDIKLKMIESEHTVSKFDLTFNFKESEAGLFFNLEYNTDLFKKKTIQRFISHLDSLIQSVITEPEASINSLNILPKDEKELLLHTFNNTKADFPKDKTIVELFEEQVNRTPNNIAVIFEDKSLTYQELNELTNEVGHYLKKTYKVQPDDIVALQLERSDWMIVAILGIMKSGAAYLPIATDAPRTRTAFMLKDAQAKVLLTDETTYSTALLQNDILKVELVNQMKSSRKDNLEKVNSSKDLAYIIYTSGSTGQPKGVMIEHRSIVNRLNWMQNAYPIGSNDCILQKTPYTFDVSVWELLWWSLQGAKVAILAPKAEKEPAKIIEAIVAYKVSTMHFVPSMFNAFFGYIQQFPLTEAAKNLRQIFTSGEALGIEQVQQFFNYLGNDGIGLYNLYGPTEASIDVSYFECSDIDNRTSIPIGQPIDNMALFILNGNLGLSPIGVKGELCISGVGLARGYLNNNLLTKEKFIPHPFIKGEKLYKTGDLARWLPDGNIEFLGRIDYQVKIRGYRIELGEVETKINQLSDVQQCVVIVKEHADSRKLIAYYVPNNLDLELSFSDFKNQLLRDLPDYMIPAFFIPIDAIPLTQNGKTDRKKLIAFDLTVSSTNKYVAPNTPTEQKMLKIWQDKLKIKHIGIHDNFFELGGDSIKAISLIHQINTTVEASLTTGDIFEYPTIFTLSEQADNNEVDEIDKLDYLLAEDQIDNIKQTILSDTNLSVNLPTDWEDFYPMSDIQKGMVFHSLKGSKFGVYQDQFFYQIKDSSFNCDFFSEAYAFMIQQHEILRTSLHLEDFNTPIQIVHSPNATKINITLEDISTKSKSEQKAYLENYLLMERTKFFRLRKPELHRMRLFELGGDEIGILWIFHHAILDGWSVASFFTELTQIYINLKKGISSTRPSLAVKQKDYIIEQWKYKLSEKTRNYWENWLAESEKTSLPYHKQSKEKKELSNVKRTNRNISKKLYEKILLLASQQKVGIKEVFLAAYCYLIKFLTSEEEVIIGLISNGRPAIKDGSKMLGCFLNSVPFKIIIPTDISGQNLIKLVWRHIKGLKPHEKLSLLEIANLKEHSGQNNPLFDTIFNYINFHVYESLPEEINYITPIVDSFENTNTLFDLTVAKSIKQGDIELSLTYSVALYTSKEIEKILDYYLSILKHIVNEPSLPIASDKILSKQELHQLLSDFNNTKTVSTTDKTIIDLFEEQVEKTPNNIAIVFEQTQLTFQQLNEQANNVGYYLRKTYNIQPNDIIALQLERSEWMIIAILGIMKAGAAYLPIATDIPDNRLTYMLENAEAKVLLIDESNYSKAKEMEAELSRLNRNFPPYEVIEKIKNTNKRNLERINSSKDLVYTIYTSGSTGMPKGVAIEHRNIVNYICWAQSYIIKEQDVTNTVLAQSIAFDLGMTGFYGALMSGYAVHLPNKEADVIDILQYIFSPDTNVDWVKLTPSHIGLLEQIQISKTNIKLIVSGGELLTPHQLQVIKRIDSEINVINHYGPTETTVGCISGLLNKDGNKIPIGKPIFNTQILILDKNDKLLPIGVAGEVTVSGAGVGRCYLNNPTLTAKKFIAHPFKAGERIYKTGDLARWLPNGTIEILGRIDNQVKIRGYRVEIGEIEQVLLSHPAIKAVVVIDYELKGTKELVAYLVAKDKESGIELEHSMPDMNTLRSFLIKSLPDYMIPAYFVELEDLPLTSNGKVNRKALPNPNLDSLVSGMTYEAPRTNVEQTLVDIWGNLLGRKQISIHDNFFAIGGHSLRAIRLVTSIKAQLATKIKLSEIFAHPTISSLAQLIEPKEEIGLLKDILIKDQEQQEEKFNNQLIEEEW